jgi:RNase P/RNase MRP subunit POP5
MPMFLKMKTLPSKRQKQRYVLIKAKFTADFCTLKNIIVNTFSSLFGLVTLARCNMGFKKSDSNFILVKIDRKYTDLLKAALCFGLKNENKTVYMESCRMSGSIAKAKGGI